MNGIRQFFGRNRHVVADLLDICSRVEHRPQIGCLIPKLIYLRVSRVCLEKHVLVHVSKALVLGGLRVGTVLNIDLYRSQRNAVILDDYYLESIGQNLALDDLFQLGSLSVCRQRYERCNKKSDGGEAAPEIISFRHVKYCESAPRRLRGIGQSA